MSTKSKPSMKTSAQKSSVQRSVKSIEEILNQQIADITFTIEDIQEDHGLNLEFHPSTYFYIHRLLSQINFWKYYELNTGNVKKDNSERQKFLSSIMEDLTNQLEEEKSQFDKELMKTEFLYSILFNILIYIYFIRTRISFADKQYVLPWDILETVAVLSDPNEEIVIPDFSLPESEESEEVEETVILFTPLQVSEKSEQLNVRLTVDRESADYELSLDYLMGILLFVKMINEQNFSAEVLLSTTVYPAGEEIIKEYSLPLTYFDMPNCYVYEYNENLVKGLSYDEYTSQTLDRFEAIKDYGALEEDKERFFENVKVIEGIEGLKAIENKYDDLNNFVHTIQTKDGKSIFRFRTSNYDFINGIKQMSNDLYFKEDTLYYQQLFETENGHLKIYEHDFVQNKDIVRLLE